MHMELLCNCIIEHPWQSEEVHALVAISSDFQYENHKATQKCLLLVVFVIVDSIEHSYKFVRLQVGRLHDKTSNVKLKGFGLDLVLNRKWI